MKKRINRVLFDSGADFKDIDPVYLVKFCEEELEGLSYKIDEYNDIYKEIKEHLLSTLRIGGNVGLNNGMHPSELLVVQDGNGDERLRFYTDGNVGMGTDSPSAMLYMGHVEKCNADELVIENSDHTGISILTPDSIDGFIF